MRGTVQGQTITAVKLSLVTLAVLPCAFASAQDAPQDAAQDVPREASAFVEQAPEDASSKVYFPDAITPESVAAARARAAQQQQIEAARGGEDASLSQVSASGDTQNDVSQVAARSADPALAQLTPAERQVLLEAVEGTDICERGSDIPALKELCDARIETRSEEFGEARASSAEDSLLGGGLDAGRTATLQAAIARLAGADANPANFDNQVVASVALNNQALSDAQATAAEGDPTAGLSPETQGLVNAIVQQLGGGG
ncbi:hypothetical protein INR77_15125 [Erythrobacter sp. SCSIO 43205]|uniref:hypothetical protein n=1 Tax=Erythrobacter sp. SCSIO 43205 TaxID=2779361 RepID=UPI001CAA2696|nr:hypothetical protein [Erythrobacter sp. SCSIO 43205]UAB78068.1 hypothetical protein INR77_15125 [Erythrobacter sp. SCSIO 43205]